MVYLHLISGISGPEKFTGTKDSEQKLRYLYLGIAQNASNMELTLYQPIWHGKNSGTHVSKMLSLNPDKINLMARK